MTRQATPCGCVISPMRFSCCSSSWCVSDRLRYSDSRRELGQRPINTNAESRPLSCGQRGNFSGVEVGHIWARPHCRSTPQRLMTHGTANSIRPNPAPDLITFNDVRVLATLIPPSSMSAAGRPCALPNEHRSTPLSSEARSAVSTDRFRD